MPKAVYPSTTISAQMVDSKAYFKLVQDFAKAEESMTNREYEIKYPLYEKALHAEAVRQAKGWLNKYLKCNYVFHGAEFSDEELIIQIIIK